MNGKFGIIGQFDGWKKGDMRGNQMVNIVLNSHNNIREGLVSISPTLASDGEVDEVVDRLIKDLEAVRKKAKENIRQTNEKMNKS
jgi:DNA-binding protein YbaB